MHVCVCDDDKRDAGERDIYKIVSGVREHATKEKTGLVGEIPGILVYSYMYVCGCIRLECTRFRFRINRVEKHWRAAR